MITFNFQKGNQIFPDKMIEYYPEVLWYSGILTILIDDKVFFSDEYFNIFEFLISYRKWNPSEREDMYYHCLDTMQNPLLSFIFVDNGWKVTSPWQKFESKDVYSYEEIAQSIEKMIKEIGY